MYYELSEANQKDQESKESFSYSGADLVHGNCYAEWEHLQKRNIFKVQGTQRTAML